MQRGNQIGRLRWNVAVKEGPGVIAAKSAAAFKQQQRDIGPPLGQAQGGKRARQPAAYDHHGQVCCHGRSVAQPIPLA